MKGEIFPIVAQRREVPQAGEAAGCCCDAVHSLRASPQSLKVAPQDGAEGALTSPTRPPLSFCVRVEV